MSHALKLPQGYGNALRCLVDGPRPRQTFSAQIARAMERAGHADLVRRPSPIPAHQGKMIDHLALTPAGRLAADEMEDDGPAAAGQLQPGRALPPALAPTQSAAEPASNPTDFLDMAIGMGIGFGLGKSSN